MAAGPGPLGAVRPGRSRDRRRRGVGLAGVAVLARRGGAHVSRPHAPVAGLRPARATRARRAAHPRGSDRAAARARLSAGARARRSPTGGIAPGTIEWPSLCERSPPSRDPATNGSCASASQRPHRDLEPRRRAGGERRARSAAARLLVGDDLRDRRPVRRAELPEHLVQAVLAAEDANFFEHRGISLQSMLRAIWINLKGGEVRQGGSTLTQQLVKNLYLTHERTLLRKLREGVLSLLVELRFDKEEILEAYLNEIYWGRARGVNLMGMGAAARAYFGCDARELDTAEAALLAGMLRSPGSLDPARHPEASRARRDEVLARMHELGWLDDEGWRAAAAEAPVALPTQVRAAHARLLPRRHGARGAPPLRARGAAVARLHAAHDARPRRPVRGGEGAHRRARPRRGERSGSRAPGRAALARSRLGRDPGLGGRAQLRGQPVRPRRARSPPAGQRVQAGDLRRRLRQRCRHAVDSARGRAALAHGRRQGVGAAERRSSVPRLGHRPARARRQHQRRHHPARRAHRVGAGGRYRARAGHRRAAPSGAVARAGLDRGGAASARHGLRHARRAAAGAPSRICSARCSTAPASRSKATRSSRRGR